MKIFSANAIAPDGTPRFAALHLGLFFLLMSHKKDARLILYGLKWTFNIKTYHTGDWYSFGWCTYANLAGVWSLGFNLFRVRVVASAIVKFGFEFDKGKPYLYRIE